MAVTADKYELPICIEDTATLLAKKLGVDRNHIYSHISKNSNGRYNGYKVVKVNIGEVKK